MRSLLTPFLTLALAIAGFASTAAAEDKVTITHDKAKKLFRIEVIIQIDSCNSPTDPTPKILPSINALGRIVDTTISTTLLVFSSMTERMTFTAYSRIDM